MASAFVCDGCRRFVAGRPLHTITLNDRAPWVEFGSFKCMAVWTVKNLGGTDLLDIHTLSDGTTEDEDGNDVWPAIQPDHKGVDDAP